MNPSVQYFNKPMMYGSPFSVEQNMVGPTPVNAFNEPMAYNAGSNMISMELIPSPIGFNNGRLGPIMTANNGIIYIGAFSAFPYRMWKLDPSTNILTLIYEGGVPAGMSSRRFLPSPTGTIIALPSFNQTIIGEFNPVTETFSSFGSLPTGNSKTWGGVLAPNGKIYCSPYGSTSIIVIDPVNRSAYTFGSFGGGFKWAAPVLATNGKIYCPPFQADNRVLVIDPKDDTFYFLCYVNNSMKIVIYTMFIVWSLWSI